jgi:ketosteroid isomerase-like protein
MSAENVAFVEGLLAGATQMDKQGLLAALPELIAETCTPDIEWVEDPQRADSRVYYGHQAVRESWERWLEQWEHYGFEAERFTDCGENVLVIAREQGRGVASGASVSARNYAVSTIREGKIARYREFYDEHAALKAVGLEE